MSSLLTELQTHPGRPPAEARPRFFAPVLQDHDGDAFRISHGYRPASRTRPGMRHNYRRSQRRLGWDRAAAMNWMITITKLTLAFFRSRYLSLFFRLFDYGVTKLYTH